MEANSEIERLIKVLKYGRADEVKEASGLIAKIGGPAVLPLFRALDDNDWNNETNRKFAGFAIAGMGNGALEPCIQALTNEEWTVRRRAVASLKELGRFFKNDRARVVEALNQALKDEDIGVREAAKEALDYIEGGN